MSHTYKNKTDRTLVLPDLGIVVAGGEFTTDKVIENPNLQLVDRETPVPTTTTEETV